MSRKNKGEVWFAKFQFEEIEGFKYRPVVVLDDGNFDAIKVLVVKVTTKNRNFDTDFSFKIGDLHQDDLNLIETKFMEYILNNK